MLAAHIATGERLIGMSMMVGDHQDFHVWRTHRTAWASETRTALATHRGDAPARTFERVASEAPAAGMLAEDLPLELQRVREALDILRSLDAQPHQGQDAFVAQSRGRL